jgi:hypothetical protein
MGKLLLHERIRGKQEAYALNMLVQGEKALYKAACAQTEGYRMVGPRQDCSHRGAGSRAAEHRTITRPRLYKGA